VFAASPPVAAQNCAARTVSPPTRSLNTPTHASAYRSDVKHLSNIRAFEAGLCQEPGLRISGKYCTKFSQNEPESIARSSVVLRRNH
jgi:hypothetical protein